MTKITEDNNLLVKHPEICKKWDYERNKLGPENYTPGSDKKVWWVCKNNHEWVATISSRICGNGCPYCSGRLATKENNLLFVNPEICKEWSDKNELSAENCTPNSGKKVWWRCKKCRKEWEATIINRNRGGGCRFCAGKEISENNNLLVKNPELCKDWNYKKNKLGPENYTSGSNKKVWWKCKNNHEYEMRITHRKNGSGCPYCAGRRVSKENNLLIKNSELCKDWNYKNNKLDPTNYTPGSNKKVWWVCKNNHEWEAVIKNRNNGNGCPYCSGKKVSGDNNLLVKNPELCKDWNYKKNKLGPENYTLGSEKKVWWTCKNNHEWEARINNRNNGNGCPYCVGQRVSKENNLLIKNSELCKDWNCEKNKLGPENYTLNSSQKVWWKCKNNHEWKSTVDNRNKGRGCPFCSKSVSKLSQEWLDKLNVKIREYKIPYTNYKVDGYDPETNTIYEFYGDKWHGNPAIYKKDDINPINKKSYGELYDKTIQRENILKLMGYKIITIWESEYLLKQK